MRISTLLAPAAGVLLSGCLASKGDIRLLQDDLSSTRAQQAQQATAQERARARDDSLARVRLDSAIRALGMINDSLHALSERFVNYQATSNEARRDLAMQLTTLQNRVGISQRQIQDLAAQRDAQAMAGSPAGSTSTPADSGKPALPGPAQLFKQGRDLYNNGSYSTARQAFSLILSTYPSYADLPNAAVMIGVCFEAEGNPSAADSVYQSVVKQYPQSPYVATALYKSGALAAQQGKYDAARADWQRVLKEYPASTEAQLVPDRLKALPGGN
jgi:TolA-binding protein